MHCQACGAQLPSEANACPNCGTLTPAYYAKSGASPHDPTIPAVSGSSPSAVSAPPPSTPYGSNPYDVNPYNVAPPPPPPRKVSPVMVGILIAVVLLVVGASVGFVLLRNQQTKTTIPPTAATSAVSNTGNADTNATATATAYANATATAEANPYGGTLALSDPLRDNSRGYGWVEGGDNTGSCQFRGGAYHVSELILNSNIGCYASPDFSNFAFEVEMTIIKGDIGGIGFRFGNALHTKYEFYVTQNGTVELFVAQGTATTKTLVKPVVSPAVHQGLNQTNIIAVVAQGNIITLYVNSQQIARVTDNTYSHGQIGLYASSYATAGHLTEVVYSNARVWTF